jgi:hypothetical protein
MKYLRSYNESLRDLMTPKSEEEILKSLKKLDNSDLLRKSIDNEFLKGIELALQHELTKNDINYIKNKIFEIKNKEIVKLLLNKIRNELNDDQIYIIEKYVFGLHQDKEKDYEIWFKEMLTDLEISRSTNNTEYLIYKKDGEVLYNYNEKNEHFWISYDKIWLIFQIKFHLNYDEIKMLSKGMVEEHLNLNTNITIPGKSIFGIQVEEHLNLNTNITTSLIYSMTR